MRLSTLAPADRALACEDAVQRMTSRLFDSGFSPEEIATAQVKLYASIALLGMNREQAAQLLRDTANGLD